MKGEVVNQSHWAMIFRRGLSIIDLSMVVGWRGCSERISWWFRMREGCIRWEIQAQCWCRGRWRWSGRGRGRERWSDHVVRRSWNEWLGILLLPSSLASHLHLELFERRPFRPSAGGWFLKRLFYSMHFDLYFLAFSSTSIRAFFSLSPSLLFFISPILFYFKYIKL